MKAIKIILFIFLIDQSVSCNIFFEPEHSIKLLIAKDGDRQADESDISLYKTANYYLGYKRGDNSGVYYIAYQIDPKSDFKICDIYSSRKWDKNDSINRLIIKACKIVHPFDLKIDLIYDNIDSINILLIDDKNFSNNSNYSVGNIYEIDQLNKFKLQNCYGGSKCPRF